MLAKKKKIVNNKKKGLSEKKLAEIRFFSNAPIKPRWEKILSSHVNKPFRVHNGKILVGLVVSLSMIGFKFGEFAFGRKVSEFIHEKSKSKNKK